MRPVLLIGLSIAALLVSCADPLSRDTTKALRRQLIESRQRQIQAAGPGNVLRTQSPETTSYIAKNPERIEQLDLDTGPVSLRGKSLPPSTPLDGESTDVVNLSLEQVVRTTVRNSLDLKLARLEPAIRQAELAAAEAAFDAIFFAEGSWGKNDRPQPVRLIDESPLDGIPPVPVGVGVQTADTANLATGIRKPLAFDAQGRPVGQITLSTGFDYAESKTPGILLEPNPSWNSNILLGIQHPLLRDFGTDVQRAQIAISRNAHRRDVLELHRTLLSIIAQVETAYWELILARRQLAIRQALLEMTNETRDILIERGVLDVTAVQQAQAQAFVEGARTEVVVEQQNVRAQSDLLKRLMNDPNLPITSETLIVPVDDPVEAAVEYNLLDSVLAALRNRPEARQALLEIDNASIRQKVADNQRLPRLDVNAQLQYHGINNPDDGLTDSYGNLSDGDFIEYIVGAQFEQPIGNRQSRAAYQAARLVRQQSVLAYQRVSQDLLLEVKNALREQQVWYEQIAAARDERRSSAEYLRTITERQEKIEGLSADFVIDQKLRAQQQLAAAQARENNAIIRYNISVMRVHLAQGTLLEHNQIEMAWPEDMFADE